MEAKKPYIKITKDGPYLVFGIERVIEKKIVVDDDGISVEYGDGRVFEIKPDKPVALCRCGRSKESPFCDGEHCKPEHFDGTESAGFGKFTDDADVLKGPSVTLLDNQKLCAFARFCDAAGRVWNLVEAGGEAATEQAIREANLCPAGRLIILDSDGNVMEDKLPFGIGVIEDLQLNISGPIWVQGGIRVEGEDGQSYEVRMKQTLCRCGRSDNKPFCNGAHAAEPGWRAHYK
ncbi:MAG: CDGSH iron-sulfur domain-containing protein [Victivallales bacterium]|nr:CDGSH iron-sulfur domain-containing protein [Victivallales bacterium]